MSARGTERGRLLALVAVAGTLALAAPATAQPAPAPGATAAEATAAADEAAASAPQATTKESENGAPELPFTGADAVVIGALTLSLLAAAFALRRFSTR
jgi:hypothetical protein